MYNELLSLVKKPVLWQRSDAAFWDDEHISKGMLEAHLDPERNAASRPERVILSSVQWLLTMLPAGCKLLDLGCGPGLYTGRLSRLGYRVTGMDLSRRSIDHARKHDELTEYVCGSYLELDRPGEFDAVTLIYCDYGALTEPERLTLLPRIYDALRPGGLFIFDVFTPRHQLEKSFGSSWRLFEHGGFWSPRPHLCLSASHLYEEARASVDQTLVITEDRVREYLVWDTVFDEHQLRAELEPFGFEVAGVYGSVCGEPFSPDSPTLCLAAVKPL